MRKHRLYMDVIKCPQSLADRMLRTCKPPKKERIWKKFNEDNPPKPDRFLVLMSGYSKPHVTVVEKTDFWGTLAYRENPGGRIYPKNMEWWAEIPKFDGVS